MFVVDDTASNDGSITNGWSLSLTTAPILLQVNLVKSTNALVSWPPNLTNGTLQSSPSLISPAWGDITNEPVIVGGRLSVTNPMASPTRFYASEKTSREAPSVSSAPGNIYKRCEIVGQLYIS